MNETFLTTTDNPYNPFTQFDQWYTYDYDKGYMTCALVAKLAKTNDSLSDELNDEIIEEKIRNENRGTAGRTKKRKPIWDLLF